jgi:acetyltransferase-like isoleucine patch superfamily enzyme
LKVLSKLAFLYDLVRILFFTYGKTNAIKLKSRFRNSTISRPNEVQLSNLDNVYISKKALIHAGLTLRLCGECHLFIGEESYLGPNLHISGIQGRIIIGKKVMIADNVLISTAYHKYEDVTKPVKEQGYEFRGNVIIGDGCWIGMGSAIMPGVEIGENSVIGANSVVTHDIPAETVAAGNPARIIKQYNPIQKRWENK